MMFREEIEKAIETNDFQFISQVLSHIMGRHIDESSIHVERYVSEWNGTNICDVEQSHDYRCFYGDLVGSLDTQVESATYSRLVTYTDSSKNLDYNMDSYSGSLTFFPVDVRGLFFQTIGVTENSAHDNCVQFSGYLFKIDQ